MFVWSLLFGAALGANLGVAIMLFAVPERRYLATGVIMGLSLWGAAIAAALQT